MMNSLTTLGTLIDPMMEEPTRLSRRGFIGLAGSMLATAGSRPCLAMPSLTDHKPDDAAYWRWIADQFLIRPDIVYMNTGTRGPSPESVYRAQVDAITQANVDRQSYATNVYNSTFKASLRAKMANFVGAAPNEIAITNNTTEGMAIGTFGPDMAPGDEIIYSNHDHSSGGQPINLRCTRYGTIPKMVDISAPEPAPQKVIDAFAAAITNKTRLISFSHINYTDGYVMPVKELCALARSKGILSLVDGAHPPGMLDLNLHDLGCDMYAGAGHKWMMAGQLTGFFYVRESLLDTIWPLIYSGPVSGKNMYGAQDDNELALTAAKYEMHGSYNYAAGVSLNAAIDFHSSIGKPAIEKRTRYMAGRLTQGLETIDRIKVLSSADEATSAALVAFKIVGMEPKKVCDLLWERHRIYLRNVTHPEINWDANRASLHLMVRDEGIDRLLAAVAELAGEQA